MTVTRPDSVTIRKERADAPPIAVTFTTTAQPGTDSPGAVYTASLLRVIVDQLEPTHHRAHESTVPAALEHIETVLENAGMSPATVLKVSEQIRRELHVLVADVVSDAKTSLRRRMAVHLAATLVPRLDGGVQQ